MQVGHVDVASNVLQEVQRMSCPQAFSELCCTTDLRACWQPVEGLLRYLQSLPEGHYLLQHVPGCQAICCLRAWSGSATQQVISRTLNSLTTPEFLHAVT